MYCDIAELDQFFWIFVNKDENYNWVAVVKPHRIYWSSDDWNTKDAARYPPGYGHRYMAGPVTTTLTIGLSDFDMRRLEALQMDAA